jgi:hypothetical protein
MKFCILCIGMFQDSSFEAHQIKCLDRVFNQQRRNQVKKKQLLSEVVGISMSKAMKKQIKAKCKKDKISVGQFVRDCIKAAHPDMA